MTIHGTVIRFAGLVALLLLVSAAPVSAQPSHDPAKLERARGQMELGQEAYVKGDYKKAAQHFIDAFAGWAIVGASFFAWNRIERSLDARRAAAGLEVASAARVDTGSATGAGAGAAAGADVGADVGVDVGADVGVDVGADVGVDVATGVTASAAGDDDLAQSNPR